MSTVIGRQVTYPMFDQTTPKSVLEYVDQRLSSRPDHLLPRIRIRHLSISLTRNQWLDITMETSPHLTYTTLLYLMGPFHSPAPFSHTQPLTKTV
jgi:hypothetical protein